MIPAAHPIAQSNAPEPEAFIKLMVQKSFVRLCGRAGAAMEPSLRLRCRLALETLWRRRRALTRLLRTPLPTQQMDRHASGGRPSPLDSATLALHLASSKAARALLDQVGAQWRDLELSAAERGAPAAWPPSPGVYAQAVRCAIEHATGDAELRLALMETGIAIAVPQYVALCTSLLTGRQAVGPKRTSQRNDAAALQTVAVAPAANTASPLADLLPGQWCRMVLHQQWTDAQLTWRSHNGRFFMFSSQLAGKAHSLSRPTLEGLIMRGHFEKCQAA